MTCSRSKPIPSPHYEPFYYGAALTHIFVLCGCSLPFSSGIPLAFPQWRDGQVPFNGFADKMEWTVVGTVRQQQQQHHQAQPELLLP